MGVLSSPLDKSSPEKVAIKPLVIKGLRCYQKTEFIGQKAIHHNLSQKECLVFLFKSISQFKQTYLYTTTADYQILANKKQQLTILKKAPTKSPLSLQHNRQKNYILTEGKPIPFLVHLGIMNAAGKVHAQKMDKFKQINRFLELVDDVVSNLDKEKPVHIVDFGCGKAYLTFALYHYLRIMKELRVTITGLDLKSDVITHCQQLTEDLGMAKDLRFILGDINAYNTEDPVDMVVSLHACDTATDAALEKAIRWQAKVILCVPCCQHELFDQVKNQALSPLLKHGILKERFAALATDAGRAQLLSVLGYETQILEFIDMEHTPKNLLIRAVKRSKNVNREDSWADYEAFKKALSINPSLERRFQSELPQPR